MESYYAFCSKCQQTYLFNHQCPAAGLPERREKTTREDRMSVLEVLLNDVERGFRDVVHRQSGLDMNHAESSTHIKNLLHRIDRRLDYFEKEIAAVRRNTRPLKDKIFGKK